MSLLKQVSQLALHQVLGDRAESVMQFLGDRFSDRSQRVPRALRTATQRAWKSMEISLAGNSWWDRCKQKLAAAEEQSLGQQIRGFLKLIPPTQNLQEQEFRKVCLQELQSALKANHLPGVDLEVEEVQEIVKDYLRFGDSSSILQLEMEGINRVGLFLEKLNYFHLSTYVTYRPKDELPLLVVAVRYFFRREVESDPQLAAGLTFQQLEGLTNATEQGFRNLHDAFERHEKLLTQSLAEIHDIVSDTRDDVRAMREELQVLRKLLEDRQNHAPGPTSTQRELDQLRLEQQSSNQQYKQLQEIYEMACLMMKNLPGQGAVTVPGLSPPPQTVNVSFPSPEVPVKEGDRDNFAKPPPPIPEVPKPAEENADWEQVRALLARCQEVPPEQRRQMPAFFRAVTRLNLNANSNYKNPFGLSKDGTSLVQETEWDSPPKHTPPRTEIPMYPPLSADTACPPESPGRQIPAKPLSKLFQGKQSSAQTPPEEEPRTQQPEEPGKGRLISSIFLGKSVPETSENPSSPEQESAPGQTENCSQKDDGTPEPTDSAKPNKTPSSRIISPLFQKKKS